MNQFSIAIQRRGGDKRSKVLSVLPQPHARDGLHSWEWGMEPSCGTYHGLNPRSWTVYDNPLPGIKLTCRQISPVIPHNYEDTCKPVAVFEWLIENKGGQFLD